MRKGKIYYEIEDSTYYADYKQFRFYFTSILYQEKFKYGVETYIHSEYAKLKFRYSINENQVEVETLKLILLLNYYKKLEKRGFRVYYNSNYMKGVTKWQRIDK